MLGCRLIHGAVDFQVMEVPADPEAGFYHAYLLKVPESVPPDREAVLVVEGNNTGRSSDDATVHLESVRRAMTGRSIGRLIAEDLGMPFLMPVFPRPKSDSHTYTHALDRDTILIDEGPLHRIDLQLLAMIRDATRRLEAMGWQLEPQFAVAGFSASASFANRFVLLHPDKVRWVLAGGFNGILALPVEEIGGEALFFPLGIADIRKLTGQPFNAGSWKEVPQFLFMGELDENDAVLFDDAYSKQERKQVFSLLGRQMLPGRWNKCQDFYRAHGANCQFHTFPELGHDLNSEAISAILQFVRAQGAD